MERLPWWPELAGVRALEPAPVEAGDSFVLNGQLSELEALPDTTNGRRAFRFQRSLLVERAGPIELDAGTLSFDYAESFTERPGRRISASTLSPSEAPAAAPTASRAS